MGFVGLVESLKVKEKLRLRMCKREAIISRVCMRVNFAVILLLLITSCILLIA